MNLQFINYLPSQAVAANISTRPMGLKYPYHYPAIAEGLGHYKPNCYSLNLSNVSFSMPASNIKTIINELPNLTATATNKLIIKEQLFAQPRGIYALFNRQAKLGVPNRSIYGELSSVNKEQSTNNNSSVMPSDHVIAAEKELRLSAYSSLLPTPANVNNNVSPYHLQQSSADFTFIELKNVDGKFLKTRNQRTRIPSNQSSTSNTVELEQKKSLWLQKLTF